MPNTTQNSELDNEPWKYPESLPYLEEHQEMLQDLDKICHGAAVHLEHELRLWQEHGRPCLEKWRVLKPLIDHGCPSLF